MVPLLPASELLSFLKQTHSRWTERNLSKAPNLALRRLSRPLPLCDCKVMRSRIVACEACLDENWSDIDSDSGKEEMGRCRSC